MSNTNKPDVPLLIQEKRNTIEVSVKRGDRIARVNIDRDDLPALIAALNDFQ